MAKPLALANSPLETASRNCDDLFERVAGIQGSRSYVVVEVLRQQFQQWTQNLGVYAYRKLSLDASLAHSESLRGMVLQLLKIVERNLLRVEQLEAERSNEDGHGDDPPGSIIDQMRHAEGSLSSILIESLKILESAVDSLLRLGVAIQQSSASTLTQRVSAFVKRQDDGVLEDIICIRLQRHLIEQERRQRATHGAALSLCRQLASSLSFRCFRIEYIRSRAAKKHGGVSHEETAAAADQGIVLQSANATSKVSSHRGTAAVPPIPDNSGGKKSSLLRDYWNRLATAQSESAASIPDSKLAKLKFAEPQKSFFGASSVISIRLLDNVEYPKPPVIEPGARGAVCPYCCKLWDKALYQSTEKWERHVDQDLLFYTCISPECVDPPKLFARFEEWKVHMDSEHSTQWLREVHPLIKPRWCCEGDGRHDEKRWFDDEAAVEQHIEKEHPEYDEGPELEAWKETCKLDLPPRPAHTCPICNSIPKNLADIIQPDAQGLPTVVVTDIEGLRTELLRHVAQHLKEVGFKSIYYLYDAEGEEESQVSVEKNKKDLAGGLWDQDGELVPPVPPYLDEEFADYTSPGHSELVAPVDWATILPTSTLFREEEPKEMLLRQLKLSTDLRGPEHPLTRDSGQALSIWLVEERKFQEAEGPCRNSLQLSEKLDGTSHHKTISLLQCLEHILEGLGRSEEAQIMAARRRSAQG
ncbi:hypothetical protein CONLIGDRAFT_100429 [Coniochaeta ligniaria NRRL 30616]|uniref:Uncharacterized protein n=1 Tax=Coniochaeta ligniaria NRRL 30616 TaxID=1408157 RepID=A0A1J7IAU8_9PEZI|nr:hypothetical protein CONLIGDRAFT_100429 [Coniochaeta ligniaria NRRL 30616]